MAMIIQKLTSSPMLLSVRGGSGLLLRPATSRAATTSNVSNMMTASPRLVHNGVSKKMNALIPSVTRQSSLGDARYLSSLVPSALGNQFKTVQPLAPSQFCYATPSMISPFHSNLGSLACCASSSSSSNNQRTFSSQPPRIPPPQNNNNNNNNHRNMGALGALGTGAVVLFGKGKYLLGALKLTKLASLGSMFLTIGTYSMFFGLPYAAGMVSLILVHEVGHALVMHNRGIPFSPMVFVPFMGAAIAMRQQPRDAWEDAMVAFGGPVLGSMGAAAVGMAGHATDSQLLIALADFGFMINLFNLLPLGSMDGGRIAGALSPYANLAGVGMGVGLAATGAIVNPVFYLILLAGGYETFQRFYNPGAIPPNYYKITPNQRVAIGLGYGGLIASLALAMDINGRYKKPPEQLMRERESELSFEMM